MNRLFALITIVWIAFPMSLLAEELPVLLDREAAVARDAP